MSEQSGPTRAENERFCWQCGQPNHVDAMACAHCGAQQTSTEQPTQGQPAPAAHSGTGLEPNIAATLSYLLTWVTGIIFLLVEKEDDYVRFHARQAIIFGVAVCVIWIALSIFFAVFALIPFIGGIVAGPLAALVWLVFGVGFLVFWVLLMVKAYQGQRYELPILSDLVKSKGAQ